MTIIQDEIVKMKAELAEMEKSDQEEEIEEVEQPEEPEAEGNEEKAEAESEKEAEQPKQEAQTESKQELDEAGYAKLRREAATEKRRAEQLEKEIEQLRKAKEPQAEELQEQIQIPPEFQSVIEDHRVNRAEKEFLAFESKVKQQYPEYGAVSAEYAAAMYQSLRIQNPKKSDIELNDMTKKAILMRAAEYARAGYENPVEEMFHEAKELGYTGKSFQKEETKPEPKEEKLQPDLRKVAENRKRSSGMTGSNGRSEGMMTVAHAATELTTAEWARLPAAEKRRLMYPNQ